MKAWEGFIIGVAVSWVFYLICSAVEHTHKAETFEALCNDRGGVVLREAGKDICLPAAITELKILK